MEPKAFNTILFQQENEQWKTDVVFCRAEIKVLNRYLSEIIDKNPASKRKEEIRQFQHDLTEKIKQSAELMAAITGQDALLNVAQTDDEYVEGMHALLKRKVSEFCSSYNVLKSLFVRFLAKADFIV